MSHIFASNNNSFNQSTIINSIPDHGPEIHLWLSPLDPRLRHQDIRSQRMDGVGSWILETREFRSWYSGGEDEFDFVTLFCDGNPGVGKSYITSLVIDRLCDEAMEQDTAVTCFYFDFATRKEQSPINMLGSLLKQLVSRFSSIPDAIVQEFEDQKKLIGGRGPRVSGILKMFQTIATTMRTFICIDALDECAPEHRVVVLDSLGHILRGSPSTRLFMTGRPHVRCEIETRLGGAAIFVSIGPTEDDVLRYLRERLRNDTNPEIMNPTLAVDIMKGIHKVSSDTFLLVSLHIDGILRETTIARRTDRLRSISNGVGLGGVYDATLKRITSQDGEKAKLAMATLMWVCHSERPLHLDELCHALAVEIGSEDFNPDNVPLIVTVLGCCQGLITVDKEALTIRLIHYTLQEYLSAYPNLFPTAHSTIAETCLTYLNSQRVRKLPPYPVPADRSMPFLKYSSRHWGTHAKREFSDRAVSLAIELLSQFENHVSAASLLGQSCGGDGADDDIWDIKCPSFFSGLHCASFFGLVGLTATLVSGEASEINQRDCTGATPLSRAAENGHEEVVRLLLEQENIDPDPRDTKGGTPLQRASYSGHEDVVKLLLKQENVSVNSYDIGGITPLACAAGRGHGGVVKILLGRQDVVSDWADAGGRTPFLFAAALGMEDVVRLLLEREDVDPNLSDEHGGTPLFYAAKFGHEGVVKLILSRNTGSYGYPDELGRTPLWHAASEGHEGVLRLLLEQGDVDVDCQDTEGVTPLLIAAENGHEGVVKLLIEREDIDPNRPDNEGRTALELAAAVGNEEIVKTLLEREDVDPNFPDNKGRTPLLLAAGLGNEGVVKTLLGRKDINPNCTDNEDGTPLLVASAFGEGGIVKILLEREDIDPNCWDNHGDVPLLCAAAGGHEGVVGLLLNRRDVDPNRPNNKNHRPLGCAAAKGHEGVVMLLLEREDIDPNCAGFRDQTALWWAAASGKEGVVKILLEWADAGFNPAENQQNHALIGAAGFGQEEVVRALLGRRDVDPNYSDDDGRTPLWYASANGHVGVVKLLLERGDVDLNRPDVNGRTPLVSATVEGHERVLELFLEREDVDPDPGDRIDRKPLGCAGTIRALLKRKRSQEEEEGEEGEEKAKRVRGEEKKASCVGKIREGSREGGKASGEPEGDIEDEMMEDG